MCLCVPIWTSSHQKEKEFRVQRNKKGRIFESYSILHLSWSIWLSTAETLMQNAATIIKKHSTGCDHLNFFQQTRIIYVRHHKEHQINAQYLIFVCTVCTASVHIVFVYINSHLIFTGTLWGSQTKRPFIEESVDQRGQWTWDHTSRQKHRSSPCYSHIAPTRVQKSESTHKLYVSKTWFNS